MKNLLLKFKMLFSVLVTWFANLLRKNDVIVKIIAPVAVNICNIIKEYNGSDIVSAIEAWAYTSGGTWAKYAVGLVRSFLTDAVMDKVIAGLNIANMAAGTENVADKLKIILDYAQSLEKDEKAKAWTKISANIAAALSDGRLSAEELYIIVQGIYQKRINEK